MVESYSDKMQTLFYKTHGYAIHKRSVYMKPHQLVQDMIRYKKLDAIVAKIDRKKCIIIEDSFIKYFGQFEKKSYILNPKNPLKKDETVIDYDMSSEEEWNEQNGEDVDAKNQ